MPTIIMESGKQNLQNVLEDDLGSELINADRFCYSCEQIFANRQCLEEHVCSCVSYICSCGTEFADYKDMQKHSTTHKPGHQVLTHRKIKQHRIQKCVEEEQKLQRLQIGDTWKTQKVNCIPPVSLQAMPALQKSSCTPQFPIQSALMSQVPALLPSASQASLLKRPITSGADIMNIFGDAGSPTVDLCVLYQPIVLVRKLCKLNKKETYSCGKCGQCFATRPSLVSHFSAHVTDKISGCVGCGLLLSSKKVVPRFHVCNSPKHGAKFRLITAKPLSGSKGNIEAISYRMRNQRAHMVQNEGAQRIQATCSLQQKSQNPTMADKSIQRTSTLKLKNEIVRTHSKSNHMPYVTPTLQSKIQNFCATKHSVSVSSKMHSPIPSPYNKSAQGLPVFSSGPLKTPTHSVLTQLIQTSPEHSEFKCRVCHLSFVSAHVLQRHKCAKALEFMAQHGRGGRKHALNGVTPVVRAIPAQMNVERTCEKSALGNVKKHQIVTVTLDQEDLDDDCYIVESGTDKPAEMIYQVTSSVPIKT